MLHNARLQVSEHCQKHCSAGAVCLTLEYVPAQSCVRWSMTVQKVTFIYLSTVAGVTPDLFVFLLAHATVVIVNRWHQSRQEWPFPAVKSRFQHVPSYMLLT